MKEIFESINKMIQEKQDMVLVTVISSSGSTPRSEGARMVVTHKGRISGTIGGGAVEFRSEQVAKEVLKTRKPRLEKFILAPNEVADLGMVCGGNVEIFFQYLSYEDNQLAEICCKVKEHARMNQQCWLISEIGQQLSNHLCIYSRETGFSGFHFESFPKLKFKEGMLLLSTNDCQFVVDSLLKIGKVYIFGGGHVAQALVPVLNQLDFYCVVLEDRAEFLSLDFFPEANQFQQVNLKNIKQDVHLTSNDYVVIMTRGHQYDFELAKQILTTEAYYIGVMGSKRKVAIQVERLKECGFTMAEIERINMPIGIKIKAETPAELAISVAAELIIKRAEK